MLPCAEASKPDLDARVREHALELGFDVVGVARADEPLEIDHARYLDFVARGMHGRMGYLEKNAEARRRLDEASILEGAKSVVCVGRRYGRPASEEERDAPLAKKIARYARGQDYHNHLKKKLRRLAAFISSLGEDVRARALCDIEPVLERAWAARAGIGFVGKNGLVITPGQGSYQLLGEVVTTLELIPDTPIGERCGSCTRCLDACPTEAFAAPFVLDPRRCIAYMTIEDPELSPAAHREAIGEHLFGCDVCQEVCPYNRAAPPPPARTVPFHPLMRWDRIDLDDLCKLDEASWDVTFQGTPLRRARRAGIARNAVVVALNSLRGGAQGDEADIARRAIEAAQNDADPRVRQIAAEAAEILRGGR
ncbi:MAG: tRNA epoxyqueuosine(34) reductase QueG [Polyangiaceae bacterium]|nr:tRNA epoxyqueuosine(34) reductase QueG [Polyangiaceae bacterium]